MFIEKLKENYWVILIIFSLIASYTAYSIPGNSQNVDGKVINVSYPNNEKDHVGTINVQLADDHQVNVEVSNNAKHLKKGDHVQLQESTTFFLKVQSYRFIKATD